MLLRQVSQGVEGMVTKNTVDWLIKQSKHIFGRYMIPFSKTKTEKSGRDI